MLLGRVSAASADSGSDGGDRHRNCSAVLKRISKKASRFRNMAVSKQSCKWIQKCFWVFPYGLLQKHDKFLRLKALKIMESNLLLRAGSSRVDAQSSVLLGLGFSGNMCINLFMDQSREFMFAWGVLRRRCGRMEVALGSGVVVSSGLWCHGGHNSCKIVNASDDGLVSKPFYGI